MIGIDTCFLIDLYWEDSPRNKNARALFSKIANNESVKVAVYYNCFNEFLHVITDSKRFENPLSVSEAISVIDYWCDIDRVTVLYPDDTSFKRTLAWMNRYQLGRNRVNDTQMASCYLTSGVSTIITANPKDFEIFESFEINDYR
jgi:predicted nucleic acid-binding protein